MPEPDTASITNRPPRREFQPFSPPSIGPQGDRRGRRHPVIRLDHHRTEDEGVRDGLRRLGAPGGTSLMLNSCTARLHSAAAAVTRATKVVMPVHYAGHPADLDAIDELPQLINVIRGEISLVGPRPEVPRYVVH